MLKLKIKLFRIFLLLANGGVMIIRLDFVEISDSIVQQEVEASLPRSESTIPVDMMI